MRPQHLELMVDPGTRRALTLEATRVEDGRVRTGTLIEPETGTRYPITEFVPRFVTADNYAGTFGFQWSLHPHTQADGSSGGDVSGRRFREETRWGNALGGKLILEIGSGAGRFTPHALETGATVVSLDYSRAVDANASINGSHPNLLLVQADVYAMPFAAGSFDFVMALGMLQHTPDPAGAFRCAAAMLKSGGRIACDVYRGDLVHRWLFTKYWVRPFTRGRDPQTLYATVKRHVDRMWPLARWIRRVPRIGYMINWQLLVADHSAWMPEADDDTLREWAYLDTFDMLSPAYDKPQTLDTMRRWFEEAGLTEVDVHYGYNGIEGRARKAEAWDAPPAPACPGHRASALPSEEVR